MVKKISISSKTRMQNVSFRDVDEFLEYLPKEELVVVEYLRKLIFHCIPGITEKLSYNVPFYKKHRNICFIWPASVLWGKKKTYVGVRFGLTHGYLLNDETGYLDRDGRKQVYMKDFVTISDIDIDLLKSLIFEAALIDEKLNSRQKIK